MKQYQYKTRDQYLKEQIIRSQSKLHYCKVFFADLLRYYYLLQADLNKRDAPNKLTTPQPILCLGVRSGAEVDMFRSAFFSPLLRLHFISKSVMKLDVDRKVIKKMRLAKRFGIGAGKGSDGRVIGVEVNPDAKRSDIWVGSFDDMPQEWTGRFGLLYSNSFDHSQDPERTVREWRRVAAPGAYVIIAFVSGAEPSRSDPLGGLSISILRDLWDADLVFASQTLNWNGYHEVCFRL